jgi:hypothetical protein
VRWVEGEAAVKAILIKSGKLHAWTITREETTSLDHTGGAAIDTHAIILRGYMSLDDSANTEKTFQDLIEAIRTKFNGNRRLDPGAGGTAHTSERIQVAGPWHVMYAGVLCHHCTLTLRASEIVKG